MGFELGEKLFNKKALFLYGGKSGYVPKAKLHLLDQIFSNI